MVRTCLEMQVELRKDLGSPLGWSIDLRGLGGQFSEAKTPVQVPPVAENDSEAALRPHLGASFVQ